tara:strand:+ start:190 stop:864 length:675 start_codon:yes stop_codon:yes gene_type:complete
MIELYGHPFSSFTWKAHIALLASDTRHVFKMLDPGHPDNLAFVAAQHPAGKFPVLRDGDTVVIEATAIVEYIALHHPGPTQLIPADPETAVRYRMLDRVFDLYVNGGMQRVVAAHFVDADNPGAGIRETPDAHEVAGGKATLRKAYAWLEKWLGEHGLPQHVSLVTCAAAPALFYADWVEEIPQDCPQLRELRSEILALPDVVTVVDAARPYRKLFPPGAPDRD